MWGSVCTQVPPDVWLASERRTHPVTPPTGVAKLADFGAATMLSDVSQRTFIGSIHWMAPEVSYPPSDMY